MLKVVFGAGTTEYGPGVDIELDGNDVARAIFAYLTAHDIHIEGARTVTVNGELCKRGEVYVDPSGKVIANGKEFSGRGKANQDGGDREIKGRHEARWAEIMRNIQEAAHSPHDSPLLTSIRTIAKLKKYEAEPDGIGLTSISHPVDVEVEIELAEPGEELTEIELEIIVTPLETERTTRQ
jgi:hypothetical protein